MTLTEWTPVDDVQADGGRMEVRRRARVIALVRLLGLFDGER